MQDRGLLGFAEMSDGVAKRLVERAIVSPELFDWKIAAVATAIRPEHCDSLTDDGIHHIGAAGMNEGPEPGELDVADRKLAALLKCEPGKHWFLIEAIRRSDEFAAPLGWTEIYVLRKFAAVVKRRDHGRTPVHEQIARMFGETIEYAQLEVFARGMPANLAKALQVKPGSPALTMVRRYYGLREELFEVTVTTHPEGRYTYTMDMQRSLRSPL